MTDTRPTLTYILNVRSENMFARVHVNGSIQWLHGRFAPMAVTHTITEFLQPGRNTITIDYEPFDLEKQAHSPHEGVAIQVDLKRISAQDTSTPVNQEITLFSGRYDPEDEQMKDSETSVFGYGPVNRGQGAFALSGITLTPKDIVYGNRVSDGFGRRLTLQFEVTDTPMPTPVFMRGDSLEDTETLKQDLATAYGRLHAAVAARNEDEFRAITRQHSDHLALVLGYTSGDALMNDVRRTVPLGAPEGLTLAALPPDLVNRRLEFGSEGRTVRFDPDPIAFLNAEGQQVASYTYFYCRIDGQMEICHQQSLPY